jgi:hypothetical protein
VQAATFKHNCTCVEGFRQESERLHIASCRPVVDVTCEADGNCFFAKNMATREMECIRSKARGMYLQMLPLDGVVCTSVYTHFALGHFVDDLVQKWKSVKWNSSYVKTAVLRCTNEL